MEFKKLPVTTLLGFVATKEALAALLSVAMNGRPSITGFEPVEGAPQSGRILFVGQDMRDKRFKPAGFPRPYTPQALAEDFFRDKQMRYPDDKDTRGLIRGWEVRVMEVDNLPVILAWASLIEDCEQAA